VQDMEGCSHGPPAEEVEALQRLRARMGAVVQHPRFMDTLLRRFLRARTLNLDETVTMLEEHLEFRAENKLDEATPGSVYGPGPACHVFKELQEMRRFYPHGFHKTDRQGRPVYIERLGNLDVKALLAVAEPERICQYFMHESERQTTFRLPACSLAAGRLVESSVSILDLKGLGFRAVTNGATIRTIRAIAKLQESHFPEVSGGLILVNAPSAFSMIWSAVTPMLSAQMLEKFEVFGAGQAAAAKKRLIELIAPENLPDFLGGTCTCCHVPGGCLDSDAGPWSDPVIYQTLQETPYWEIVRRLQDPAAYAEEQRRTQSEPEANPAAGCPSEREKIACESALAESLGNGDVASSECSTLASSVYKEHHEHDMVAASDDLPRDHALEATAATPAQDTCSIAEKSGDECTVALDVPTSAPVVSGHEATSANCEQTPVFAPTPQVHLRLS